MRPLAGFASCQRGEKSGMSTDISEYSVWIVDSWGGFSSPCFSSGMKMALKKLDRNGVLPIH